MAFVLADVGADLILGTVFKAVSQQNLKLKLFATNVTPADTDTTGTYTEASGGGYAAITLTRDTDWTLTTGNDPSDVVSAQKTFTFTGALTTNATVYGYYVTDNAATTLLGAEAITPYTPTTNGDTLKVTVTLKLSKGTAS